MIVPKYLSCRPGSSLLAAPVRRMASLTTVGKTVTKVDPVLLARKQLRALPKPSVQPPKRPASPYTFYVKSQHEQIASLPQFVALPNTKKMGAISKELGKRWEGLSETEKATYQKSYTKAKADYERAYDQYLSSRTPQDLLIEQMRYNLQKKIDPKKALAKPAKDTDAPKRPTMPHVRFMKYVYEHPEKQVELVGKRLDGLKAPESMRAIARAWKDADEGLKKKFQQQYETEKRAYAAAKSAYDTQTSLTTLRADLQKTLKSAVAPKVKKPVKKLVKTPLKKVTKAKKVAVKKTKTTAARTRVIKPTLAKTIRKAVTNPVAKGVKKVVKVAKVAGVPLGGKKRV